VKTRPIALASLAACVCACSLYTTRSTAQTDEAAPALPETNARCELCHINLAKEELVTAHLAQGVTCAHCHGYSAEHRDDEMSATKPDVMFGRAEVAPFCLGCHGEHKSPELVEAFLTEWKGKRRENGRLILAKPTCTDCHGTHVLTAVPMLGPGH